MTPSSSGGDAYKVNVTRTKTKKWAEFKPQNYDGDDWGTDYDDGYEEPPPMPKPMGPRQAVPPLPHLRQFQPSGAPPLQTSTQQPARPTETGSPFASAPQTAGNAPGRINIESAATGSSSYSPGPGFPQQGGSSSGSGTPLRRLSPAPPSAGPQSVPSRFPPRKSSMGQSDAPDTAELMRQSRSNNNGNNSNNSRPGSSHKPWVEPRSASPANSAKSPVSPSSGKPLPFIRPADIYRRIVEEKEKERRSMESSRPSMDSITSRGPGLERVDSAPKAASSPTPEGDLVEDQRRSSGAGSTLGPEQETEIRFGSRPSLPPVAERKSEYGLDGLLDSYGFTSDPPRVEPASTSSAPAAQSDSQTQDQNAGIAGSGPAPPSAPPLSSHAHTHTHMPTPTSASAPAPSLANQFQQPIGEQEQPQPAVTSQDDLRRISVSPKLPDLGRMSAFGDDLFSSASRYSTVFPTDTPSAPSHLAVIQDSPPPSASEQVPPPADPMTSPRTSSDDKVPSIGKDGDQQPSPTNIQPTDSSVLNSVQTPSKDLSEPGTSAHPADDSLTSNSNTYQGETSPTSDNSKFPSSSTAPSASAVSDQPPTSTPPPLESSSSTVDNQPQPPRPSFPGAWVSETPTTTEDLPTPTPVASSLSVVDQSVSSSEPLPISEPGNGAREAVGQTTSNLPAEGTTNSNKPQPLASPHILPHLRTSSPALSLSPRGSTDISQTETQGSKGRSSTESAGPRELSSHAPNTASTARDITPTAPLNPSRPSREDFTIEEPRMGRNGTVPSSDAGSTLDTTGSSPLKESDKLREEIIKSLSPLQGSSSLLGATGDSTGTNHTAAGPLRESSYLSGVYDDYWGAGDDSLKSELQLDESLTQKEQAPEKWDRPQDQAKAETLPPAPLCPAPIPASATNAAEETLPSLQQQIVTDASARPLRQRFSWEAEPEEVVQPPVAAHEPKSPGSDPQPVVVGTAAQSAPPVPSVLAPTVDASHLTPAPPKTDLLPSAEQPQAGGISHQVSGASTIPPRSTLEAPIDPPSPISVLSEQVGPDSKSRRLSLADEKAGVHGTSQPVSPTPPLGEHPALAGGASAFPAPAPAPTKREPVNLNLFPFRQTMELPSAEERIERFAETRAEYALIDSGLDEWLIEMKNRYPEHANATWSFRPPTGHQSSAHNAGQGPFSGDITEAALPPNTMPMPPHPIHVHAHGQVGTKSKELLMAAGKAGKGLFSKGKNKLRGTGDKVFF